MRCARLNNKKLRQRISKILEVEEVLTHKDAKRYEMDRS